jgi:hypothetical protein
MAAKANKKPALSTAAPATIAPIQKSLNEARSTGTNPVSKQSRVIAMLQAPNGATIAAMTKATGWQQHSLRGFLSAVVRKRLRLKLTSEKVDGVRAYKIADAAIGARPRRRKAKARSR